LLLELTKFEKQNKDFTHQNIKQTNSVIHYKKLSIQPVGQRRINNKSYFCTKQQKQAKTIKTIPIMFTNYSFFQRTDNSL